MAQPSIFWWQGYGTLAQMAQAAVAARLRRDPVPDQRAPLQQSRHQRAAGFLGYPIWRSKIRNSRQFDYDAIKAARQR